MGKKSGFKEERNACCLSHGAHGPQRRLLRLFGSFFPSERDELLLFLF